MHSSMPWSFQDRLDVSCARFLPHANTGNVSDEITVIRFPSADKLSRNSAVTLTVFSLGLDLSANVIRSEDHLKEFPGASLIVMEIPEVCFLVCTQLGV